MTKTELKKRLKEFGYEISEQSYSCEIAVKYRPKKNFYEVFENIKEKIECSVEWDINSLEDYIASFGIDRSKITTRYLSAGELPVATRWHRRTYTIGKLSSKIWKKSKFIRPLIVDIFHNPRYIALKAKEIIIKNHLKKYEVCLFYKGGSHLLGGVVGAGVLPKKESKITMSLR